MTTNAALIDQALKAARSGDRSRANRILLGIESQLEKDPGAKGGASTRKLIEFIRKTYAIHPSVDWADKAAGAAKEPASGGGVSLVTCCMNRTENLLQALPTWLALEEIDEIIVVDWSSAVPVSDALRGAGIEDRRIKIIRVLDEPRWILSCAFNLGFRHAKAARILKVDADIKLKPAFFEKNVLASGTFVAGDWEVADEGQEHINGFFYTFRDDLMRINGFNEYITTYGWDDDELYLRFQKFGLKRVCVDVETIYHIPHEDVQRLSGSDSAPKDAVGDLAANPLFRIRGNRYLSLVMPPWTNERQLVPFDVLLNTESYIEVRRRQGAMPHYVGSDIKADAEYYAALELVSWRIGPSVYHLPRADFYRLLESKRLDEIETADVWKLLGSQQAQPGADKVAPRLSVPNVSAPRRKIFADVQHGLGNRLRALASAAVIAEATDRELVAVWEADHHCDCLISDLFEYQGAVIGKNFVSDAVADGFTVFNYMEAEEGSEKDALLALDSTKDAYVRSAYVLNSPITGWDMENRWLRALRPVEAVRDLVSTVRQPNDVSAHVRMVGGKDYEHLPYEATENWTAEGHAAIEHWRERSHFSHFMKRIDALIAEGRAERVLLAADKSETYLEFQAAYGARVAYLTRDLYDRSAEQLRYALADALLLGTAPLLLGSTWSSFSELALRLSARNTQVEMSGRDF